MDQKLFEHAIKQRIQNSATWAQIKIARFYKRKLNRERCQFFRHNGMFEATIYFEHTSLDDSNNGKIKPSSNVQVYGEFTPEQPWQVLIPCTYDNKSRCFKAILVIRTGQ
jgi:maleate cis-trans isomerase